MLSAESQNFADSPIDFRILDDFLVADDSTHLVNCTVCFQSVAEGARDKEKDTHAKQKSRTLYRNNAGLINELTAAKSEGNMSSNTLLVYR